MSEPLRRGAIRVDASRAAAKIRDHLLAEPESWLAEVVRAATLLRATRVSLTHDADDLYVAFDGDPWPPRVVDRLETCVVADGSTGRSARLLAVGVFAALGHEAKLVDVVARTADGLVARRYDASAAYGSPDPDVIARLAADDTTLVHVRRGVSFAVLARFLTHRAPPEVALLGVRLGGDAIPVHLHGEPLDRPERAAALVSASSEEGALRVSVELLGHAEEPPTIELYELGVLLARVPWPASWLTTERDGGYAPIRVVVTAEQLPTNVSRSKLRDESLDEVLAAARRVLHALVVAASGALRSPGGAAIEAALGALAVVLVRAIEEKTSRSDAASLHLDALLDVPLLASATGEPRALREVLGDRPVVVREAETPLPAKYRPVSAGIFWSRPGRVVDRLLVGAPYASVERVHDEGAARAASALASPAPPFGLPPVDGEILRARFDEDGFRAEIALRRSGPPGARISVWIGDRPYLACGDGIRSIPLDAAIHWPAELEADLRYLGLHRASQAMEAISSWIRATALGLVAGADAAFVEAHGATLRAWSAADPEGWAASPAAKLPIWPALARAPLDTTAARALIARMRGYRWVSPGVSPGPFPSSEPVLVLGFDDADALRAHRPSGATARDYARFLQRPASNPERRSALLGSVGAGGPIVATSQPHEMSFTLATKPVVVHMHRGEVLMREALAAGNVAVAVEWDELLPLQGTKGELPTPLLERLELDAFDAHVAAVRGGVDLAAQPILRAVMTATAMRHVRARKSVGVLRELALFELVEAGVSRCVSGAELAKRFPDAVPHAAGDAREDTYVRADEGLEPLLARLSGRMLRDVGERADGAPAASAPARRELPAKPTAASRDPAPIAEAFAGVRAELDAAARMLCDSEPPARAATRVQAVLEELFTKAGAAFVDPRAARAILLLDESGVGALPARLVESGAAAVTFDAAEVRVARAHRDVRALVARGDAANLCAAIHAAVSAAPQDPRAVAALLSALSPSR